MAIKAQLNLKVDAGVRDKFREVCDRNDMEYSTVIQHFMEEYIAKDGQLLFDDIYAPRISSLVQQTTKREIDRLAGMLYNINVETTANLYAQSLMHKQSLIDMEKIIRRHVNDQLLNPIDKNFKPVASEYSVKEDGVRMAEAMRNFSRDYIREQKREISKHSPESKSAAKSETK